MFDLMSSRRFAPLFWTQFLSAFNDNFLKNAIVFFILFKLAGDNSEALVTLAGAIIIAPFFLFSGLGGELADRFDKAKVASNVEGGRDRRRRRRRGRLLAWIAARDVRRAFSVRDRVGAVRADQYHPILPESTFPSMKSRQVTRSSKAPLSSPSCLAQSRAVLPPRRATPLYSPP